MSLNVEILEQSFEKVKPHADEFVASFYNNLFQAHPEVKPLFANTDMANQQKKLLSSLVLVVENLRSPEALGSVLNSLGSRHISYGAIPNYYGLVGEALLLTFEQYLAEDWTPEVKQAWLDAFTAITALMLNTPTGVKSEIAANSEHQALKKPVEQKLGGIPQVKPADQILTEIPEEPLELPVEILVNSFEKVKPQADEFAASFYKNLFQAHPEVKPLFTKTDMKTQEKKLLNSLVLVVENLRNPEALGTVLKALGARHTGYGTIPKYYKPVGEALLLTFEQYLQQNWTPEVKKAWLDAYRVITALMLKGAGEESAPKVVEQPTNVAKPVPSEQPATWQFHTKRSELSFSKFKQIPHKLMDAFWIAPTWLIAIVSAVLFAVVVVIVDDNSVLGEVLGAADTVSLVVALVLFIKETPDRRKQFHYQAWGTVDAAHGVKVSYARILALQDLNEDGVSLRGLDAPGAELVDINLSHANLSNANLMTSDLTNANLHSANLDNANLCEAKLSGANLSHAKLGFTRLSRANLNSAKLNDANLICADLSHANLSGANLKNASLSGANLQGAYLGSANLKNAKVSEAELSGAFLEGAIMPDGSKYRSQN
ncbi:MULTISPECIES: globin domain-containing protein [Nostocales]|uniref:Globin n=3 Tax=Nostocales TaxID=1161 RepID=A0A0C1QSW8_9CYAN|nr:globin domain-containing protein [Tolypothrix bouteillei]KAF3883818.1 globin [Tolypothrix bouteillei VB521301]